MATQPDSNGRAVPRRRLLQVSFTNSLHPQRLISTNGIQITYPTPSLFRIKCLILQPQKRFRSSVGLEQQPSKLWVLGSNPNGITLLISYQNEKDFLCGSPFFDVYISYITLYGIKLQLCCHTRSPYGCARSLVRRLIQW